MAISDSQKVDYLFKKLGFGVAKTDTSTNKSPANESISSPLLIRGDNMYLYSDQITNTATLPTANVAGVFSVYRDTLTSSVQATNDGTAATNRTWKTNLTDWIGPEFGAGYQVKVYTGSGGSSSTAQTLTALPIDGSGNNDSWFFDYQAGVLNFADTNVPSSIGTQIWIVGVRYVGGKGIVALTAGASAVGNVSYYDNVTAFTTNQIFYPQFSNISTSGNTIVGVNSSLGYNPSTGTLSTTIVNAALNGSIGATTPNTAVFTTTTTGGLQAVAIGNATPGTGAFTTLTAGSLQGIIGNATATTAFFTTANATNLYAATIGNATTALNGSTATINSWANITATTAATSTTTGALIVAGGIGVAGNVYSGYTVTAANIVTTGSNGNISGVANLFSANVIATNVNAVTIGNSGAVLTGAYGNIATINATTVNATTIGNIGASHVGNGGFLSNIIAANVVGTVTTANVSMYDNVATSSTNATFYPQLADKSSGNVGTVVATGVNVNPSTSTISALGFVGGTGAFTTLNATGITQLTNSTDSTSTGTGALQVTGGAGILGNLWVGGNIYAANIVATTQNILTIIDPLLYLQASNPYGTYNYDIGFYSDYSASSYRHSGLARNFNSNTWTFFSNVASEPSATAINWNDAGLAYDTVKAGSLILANTTAATSATTGALQVAGGIGVAGSMYIGSGLQGTIIGNAAAATAFFTTANATNLYASIVGNVGTTFNGNTITVGNANITATTSATSTTSGALQVAGGAGVAGNVFVGGSIVTTGVSGNISGVNTVFTTTVNAASINSVTIGNVGSVLTGANLTTSSTIVAGGNIVAASGTTSANVTTGAIVIPGVGGLGVGGNVNIGGITTHAGNVAFDGAQVTHYDSIIDLHTYGNLAAWSSDDGKDIGLRMHYYNGADSLAFVGLENSSKTLQFLINATEVSGNVTGTYGNAVMGSMLLSNTTTSTSTTTGALQVAGGAGIAGNLYVGSNVYVSGSVLPTANVTYNIGSPTQRFASLYLSGNTIYLNNATISAAAGSITFTTDTGGSASISGSAGGQATMTLGNLVANSGATSTSKTTGALVVTGGVGISGDVNIGTSLTVDNGTYGNVVATQFGSLYATANSPNNYALLQAWSPATGGGLGLNAYGNVVYSGGAITFRTGATIRDKDYPTGGTTGAQIAANGAIIAQNAVTSTSSGTGALIVSGTGGAGIGGNIYVGSNAVISGYANVAGAITAGATSSVHALQGNLLIGPAQGANSADSPFTINQNTDTPVLFPNAVSHISVTSGKAGFYAIDNFGTFLPPVSSGFFARRARGTSAAPSAVQATDSLGGLFFKGYGTTGYALGAYQASGIRVGAAENFSDNSQATYMEFLTTNTGSNIATMSMFIDYTGNVVVNAATTSTSTTTGALTVKGGVGIVGAVNIGGNTAVNNTFYAQGVYDNSTRVVSTSSGAGNLTISSGAINLTPVGPGVATTGSSSAIPIITTDAYGRITAITTASVSAVAPVANVATYVTAVSLNNNQTFYPMFANVDGGNTIPGTNSLLSFNPGLGKLTASAASINGGVASTSTSSGALIITGSGGVGVGGAVYTGGNIVAGGNILISSTTNSISSTSGALQVAGGAGFVGNVYFGNAAIFNSSQTAGADHIVRGKNDATLIWARPSATYDTVIIGNSATASTVVAGAKLNINTTDSILLPVGTNSQRPGNQGQTDVAGMFRYSSTSNAVEWYNGTSWISASTQITVITDEQFNGDGSTVAFTLGGTCTTAATIVSINGVIQIPTLAYSVSSTTLTFTEAPASGDIIDVRRLTTTTTVTALNDSTGYNAVDVDNTNGVTFSTGTAAKNARYRINTDGSQVSLLANTAVASANTATTVDTVDTTVYRSAKYVIQATNGANYQVMEALLISNGTTATVTAYGTVQTNGNLGIISATQSGSNALLQFVALNSSTNVRISKEYLLI